MGEKDRRLLLAVYEEEQRMMRRRLEEAVAAFREALKEYTRERVGRGAERSGDRA
jgi:hypothetical protein